MPRSPQMAPALDWLFTINNPQRAEDVINDLFTSGYYHYIIGQLEVGENGTPHIQGFFVLKAKMRLSALKKLDGLTRAHLEKRRGTRAEARDYCQKEDTREDGPWTFGEYPGPQGRRTDLDDVYEALKEGQTDAQIMAAHPGTFIRNHRGIACARYVLAKPYDRSKPKHVTLLYGPTGLGKSRFVWDHHPESDIWESGLDGCKWFDGFHSHKVALLEEFVADCTLPQLLRLTDRYPVRAPVKGAYTQWNPERIYFCTNIHPSQWYNYSGREGQYEALVRRVTRVIDFTSGEPVSIRPGRDMERFRSFFSPPLRLTTRGDRFRYPTHGILHAPRGVNYVIQD